MKKRISSKKTSLYQKFQTFIGMKKGIRKVLCFTKKEEKSFINDNHSKKKKKKTEKLVKK